MAIRKRSINQKVDYTDYEHLSINENDSNINNFSHESNLPTNFNLKSISLEDCDQAVFLEFDKRFSVNNVRVPIILLDAELASLREQNRTQFDKDKQFFNGPFFTMYRKESKPKYRTNPTSKKLVYAIPVQKPNGVVFEEYIYDGPLSYDLIYEFKFITNFREYSNKFEEQFRYYFRNKRNIIICNNERFSIGPTNYDNFSLLEIVGKDNVDNKSLYVTTYELKLDCFVRDLSNMQKRERFNNIKFEFNVVDSAGKNISTKEDVDFKTHVKSNDKPEEQK